MSVMLFRVLSCVVACSYLYSSVSSMDSKPISPQRESTKCCDCGCVTCSLLPSSGSPIPSAKQVKNDETEGNLFSVSGLGQPSVVRIESENEIVMLRDMVNKQQQTIQDLISDLEEERNASSSAANEAMSMILRLQREKAEAQMEARQFKRLVEERMGHDQQEISALQELLYKREQVIQSLTCEVQAYKHRLMSFGLTEEEADGDLNHDRAIEEYFDPEYEEVQAYEYPYPYPPLKCNHGQVEDEENDDVLDIEKYPFGETPRLKNLIHHHIDDSEKAIVGQSPRRLRHFRRYSTDSLGSLCRDPYFDVPTDSPKTIGSLKLIGHAETPSKLKTVRDASEEGDDMSDRVYTVDYIPTTVRTSRSVGTLDDYFTTPRESFAHGNMADPDIKRLYARLQALEADRESMRHEIMSMQTDKTQLLLLKEIAECLCKRNNVSAPETEALQLPPDKKPPLWRRFSLVYVFKWIGSTVLWWTKKRPCKYTFGMSAHHVGLLILVDMSLGKKRLRCFTKAELRG